MYKNVCFYFIINFIFSNHFFRMYQAWKLIIWHDWKLKRKAGCLWCKNNHDPISMNGKFTRNMKWHWKYLKVVIRFFRHSGWCWRCALGSSASDFHLWRNHNLRSICINCSTLHWRWKKNGSSCRRCKFFHTIRFEFDVLIVIDNICLSNRTSFGENQLKAKIMKLRWKNHDCEHLLWSSNLFVYLFIWFEFNRKLFKTTTKVYTRVNCL